jgi:membrane protein DedA with SNARE-associated domain
METVFALIQEYGYAFIFLFTLLEGETVVALSGFAAYQGYLNIWCVIAVAIVGAVIGDQAFFYFGRFKGKQFLESRPKYAERLKRIHGTIERHQNLLIFASRFMYGFRTIIPIAIGTTNVKGIKFLLLNILGAIIWGIFFGLGGYAFGNALERFIGHVRKAEKAIIIGVILGAVIVQGIIFLRRRIAEKIEAEDKKIEEEESRTSEG